MSQPAASAQQQQQQSFWDEEREKGRPAGEALPQGLRHAASNSLLSTVLKMMLEHILTSG
jgi:hypothetical protein